MAEMVRDLVGVAHQVFFQAPKPRMAKVDEPRLKFLQEREKRAAWGRILARVPRLLNLTDSQFADLIDVKPNQLSAWHAGTENAALWRYYDDPEVFIALQWAQAEAKGYIRPATIELPPVKTGT